MADETRSDVPDRAGTGPGAAVDPVRLGPVLGTYRERPTMGKLGMVVVPPLAVEVTGGLPSDVPSLWRGLFVAVCLLVFLWGVRRFIRACTSWLDLRHHGLVYRGRRRVRWAHAWEDFDNVTLSREVTYLGASSRPVSDKVNASLWRPGKGARQLTGSYFRAGGETLTHAFGEIIARISDARARHDIRQLALRDGEVTYGSLRLDANGLRVDGAGEEIPWDDVTRMRVTEQTISIHVPHLRRRMNGVRLKADGSRDFYRVGGDNTLYIEAAGLSPCRRAILWAVMNHIATSRADEPSAG